MEVMFSLVVRSEANSAERDILIAELWEAGATGITEEADVVRAFFEGTPHTVSVRFAHLQATVHEEDPRDWVRFAQDQWTPFPVGDRFYLVPEWLDDPAPDGRLRLRMHPGMACGTGTHAATRLCLMGMERHVYPGDSVLDVGTGAGILADAATLLGASPVYGCDIDHRSTLVARANIENVALFTGSVRSVRTNAVDWAVCNLNAATLTSIASDLQRVARRLILSGFREEETGTISKLFPNRDTKEELELEGYACLVL